MTPRSWASLDLACQYLYFGTLVSEIQLTVMELLRVDQNSVGWTNNQTNEQTQAPYNIDIHPFQCMILCHVYAINFSTSQHK